MTICTVGKVVISNKIHFDQVSKIRQKHYDLNTVSIVVNKMGNKIRTEKRKGKIRESRCLLIIIICNPLEGVGSSSAQWGQNILKSNLNFSLILIYHEIWFFIVSILIRLKNKNKIGEVWWNFWECTVFWKAYILSGSSFHEFLYSVIKSLKKIREIAEFIPNQLRFHEKNFS